MNVIPLLKEPEVTATPEPKPAPTPENILETLLREAARDLAPTRPTPPPRNPRPEGGTERQVLFGLD